MTVILYDQAETEVVTNSTTWEDLLTVTRQIETDGDYILWYSGEIAGQLTNRGVAMRAVMDGDEISRLNKLPNDPVEWYIFCAVKGKHLTAGEHTFKIQHAVEASNQTATSRRARLTVHKH